MSQIFRDSGSLQIGEEIRQGTWRRPHGHVTTSVELEEVISKVAKHTDVETVLSCIAHVANAEPVLLEIVPNCEK